MKAHRILHKNLEILWIILTIHINDSRQERIAWVRMNQAFEKNV
jgi:hypothetical protein